MTGSRLLSKLLRFKGFRVVSWWFEGRSCFVIAVKPHKNGLLLSGVRPSR